MQTQRYGRYEVRVCEVTVRRVIRWPPKVPLGGGVDGAEPIFSIVRGLFSFRTLLSIPLSAGPGVLATERRFRSYNLIILPA